MSKFALASLSLAAAFAATGLAGADVVTTQVFSSATNPSGGITITIDNQGTPKDGLGNTLSGYTAYEMTISANTSGWGNAVVDFGNEPNDSFTGFNGPMAFEATYATAKGGTTYTPILADATTNNSPNAGTYYDSLGSHFLFSQSTEVAAGPNVDNFTQSTTGAFAGLSSGGYMSFGTGTFLRSATGFYKANQLQVLPFAYLVIPNGSVVSYAAQDVLTQESTGVNDSINFSGTIPVPEPTAAAMFALGGLGTLTLGRKRKPA